MRYEYYTTNQTALMPFSMASRHYYTSDEVMRGYKEDSKKDETPEQYTKRIGIFRIPEGNNIYRQEIEHLEKLAARKKANA